MMNKNYFALALCLLPSLFLIGCSSIEKKGDTAEAAYAYAEEYEKDDRFEEAIRRYNEVKNKFPYSSFAAKAEMKVADIHYKNEEYAEAQVSYQAFRDLHPKHPQIDYVYFRIAMSYFKQLPDSIDRDLSLASDTIASFNELLKKFPQSEHIKEALDCKEKTLKMLGEKEQYIANFYFREVQWEAALSRYDGVLKKYSGLGFDEKALLGAYRSAKKAGQNERAHRYAKTLLEKFAGSAEAKQISKQLNSADLKSGEL